MHSPTNTMSPTNDNNELDSSGNLPIATAMTEQEAFAHLFATPPRLRRFKHGNKLAPWLKKGTQLVSTVLAITIAILLASNNAASYSIAFGLSLANFGLNLSALLVIDFYIKRNQEQTIFKHCTSKIKAINERDFRDGNEYNEKLKKLKIHHFFIYELA